MLNKQNWSLQSSGSSSTKPMYFIDPQSYEQHKKLGLPYNPTSHDQELTRFFNELKDSTKYSTQISSMIRLKAYDDKDNKLQEWVTWTESLLGVDKDGNIITISDIPCGQTRELIGIQYHNGQPIPNSYPSKTKYTVQFSKEEAEKLIEKSERSDSIQYIVRGIKNWGGFSKDEFLNCTHSECESRGRLGVAGLYESKYNVKAGPTTTQQFQIIQPQEGTITK